jgi:hypothetical protein
LGYLYEGIACGVLPTNAQPNIGTAVPLYRLLKTSEPGVQPPGELTCDGKRVAASTRTYVYVVQDNVSKQLFPDLVSVKANSASDALGCAQRIVNGAVAGATAVPLDALRRFAFAVYGPANAAGQRTCSTAESMNTSSNDAETALRFSVCSNCDYVDITAAIINPDGSIDGQKRDNWCSAHPNP